MTLPRGTSRTRSISWLMVLAFSALSLVSILMGVELLKVGIQAPADAKLEHYTKMLLALVSGVGAIFVLMVKRQIEDERRDQDEVRQTAAVERGFEQQKELLTLRASIDQLTATTARTEEARMSTLSEFARKYIAEQFEPKLKQLEVAAEGASKYNSLVYEEDFRRRQRRYEALVALSRAIYRTTRVFNALCSFRLAPGESTDSLVSVLTNALTNREAFLAAREDLLVLHMVDADHALILQAYSRILTEIIIDVQRVEASRAPEGPSYEQKMKDHAAKLTEIDGAIGRILAVFLAPQHETPVVVGQP